MAHSVLCLSKSSPSTFTILASATIDTVFFSSISLDSSLFHCYLLYYIEGSSLLIILCSVYYYSVRDPEVAQYIYIAIVVCIILLE
ncbi:hypothetical protein ACN38_g2345 [Penicillium nordicum]|uniref:Uncharacterized protein n=1 Tax=Penicillium nordicum TaxID=229535 RepID=A0A0M8P7F2_9EURO|nr:hypothetical protein ACN38_g2345 [Penicillium nordicum]